MNKIAVFGSGLSAAFIIAAADRNKLGVDIYTNKELEPPTENGPIFVNWMPPHLEHAISPTPIWVFGTGTEEGYLKRMGKISTGARRKSSFPANGAELIQAYNPREAYTVLMRQENYKVFIGTFGDPMVQRISSNYMWSFITFPLEQSRDPKKLVFYWSQVVLGANIGVPNMVVYDGASDYRWSRFSQYWGVSRWEYSHFEYPVDSHSKPPSLFHPSATLQKAANVVPGVEEYMSPFPKTTLVGRWARWNKKVKSHDAYAQADQILKELK